MIALFLAAALTSAAVKPLFVPPPGFDRLTRDPGTASRLQRFGGGTILEEYRRAVHQPWGHVVLSRSIVITIAAIGGFGMDGQGFAATKLAAMQRAGAHLRQVRNAADSVCGRPGWMLSYVTPAPYDERIVEIYSQSGDRLYVASLTYWLSIGDDGALRSLRSFCPPVRKTEVAHSDEPLPFALPQGWNRTSQTVGVVASPLQRAGRWLRLSTRSRFLESLELVKGPPLQDGVTAQQQTETMFDGAPGFTVRQSRPQTYCGTDGWFASYTVDEGSFAYAVDTAYAYGTSESYILAYARKSGDPENAGAMRALSSLCAPAVKPSPMPGESSTPPPASALPSPTPTPGTNEPPASKR